MPSLLRWTSLLLSGAVLAALGTARLHHRNFPLFLGALVALAVAVVAVLLLTRPGGGRWRRAASRRGAP